MVTRRFLIARIAFRWIPDFPIFPCALFPARAHRVECTCVVAIVTKDVASGVAAVWVRGSPSRFTLVTRELRFHFSFRSLSPITYSATGTMSLARLDFLTLQWFRLLTFALVIRSTFPRCSSDAQWFYPFVPCG